ncbi:hypothetical protein K9M47_03170 [Candidatus Gracilibacteria bacterium]|nr:hypothetical protein [Candidatus Gracilibacteria bacterium]
MKKISQKKSKEVKVNFLVLKNKRCDTPWTSHLFYSENQAKEYFDQTCYEHKWNFNWTDFELVPCVVSYKLNPNK